MAAADVDQKTEINDTQALANLDKEDESLIAYKKSLGILGDQETVIIDEDNPHRLIPTTLGIKWNDADMAEKHVIINLKDPDLSKKVFPVQMGKYFNLSVRFQVQRDMAN